VALRLDVSLPARSSHLRRAREEVVRVAEAEGASAGVVDDVKLCVNEAVANAIRHAYRGEPGEVEIGVGANDDELTVVVRDWGRGFDPKHEGLGLRIIGRCTKRFLVAAVPDGGTELVMTFDLVRARRPHTSGR
jgi:anti-sigma regulatory factor (Ser/Thr protein kinase)